MVLVHWRNIVHVVSGVIFLFLTMLLFSAAPVSFWGGLSAAKMKFLMALISIALGFIFTAAIPKWRMAETAAVGMAFPFVSDWELFSKIIFSESASYPYARAVAMTIMTVVFMLVGGKLGEQFNDYLILFKRRK